MSYKTSNNSSDDIFENMSDDLPENSTKNASDDQHEDDIEQETISDGEDHEKLHDNEQQYANDGAEHVISDPGDEEDQADSGENAEHGHHRDRRMRDREQNDADYMTDSERNLAFANWLCKNTDFKIDEIARLCPGVHEFRLVLLRRGNVNLDLPDINPVKAGIIKPETLHSFRLANSISESKSAVQKDKPKVYIPKVLRQYLPGVISWFLHNYPNLSEKVIASALGLDRKKFLKMRDMAEEQVNPIAIQMFSEYNLDQILSSS